MEDTTDDLYVYIALELSGGCIPTEHLDNLEEFIRCL